MAADLQPIRSWRWSSLVGWMWWQLTSSQSGPDGGDSPSALWFQVVINSGVIFILGLLVLFSLTPLCQNVWDKLWRRREVISAYNLRFQPRVGCLHFCGPEDGKGHGRITSQSRSGCLMAARKQKNRKRLGAEGHNILPIAPSLLPGVYYLKQSYDHIPFNYECIKSLIH